MTNKKFAFTTKARIILNKILSPTGLHFETSTSLNAETDRLNKLKSNGHWQQEKYARGLYLDVDEYIKFLNKICFPYKDEFIRIPKEQDEDSSNNYYYNNEFFGTVDAEVLYSIIKCFKPKNIVEIGSGFSTRVMRLAVDQLPSGTQKPMAREVPVSEAPEDTHEGTRIICIDPQPRIDILNHADEHFAFCVENIEPAKIFNKIKRGDILFIDSSHWVATGNDVIFLFLEIIPQLPAGALIHIHDIFFPHDYPEEWVIKEGWGWNEQYLVHAFLMFNESFEILWPSHYMWIKHRDRLAEFFPTAVNDYRPSSLWIRKVK